ncbi:MAG: PQQ-dependent sugar dehydrogenase [Candidatus Daviesbacteria bacterium]|nr:MAG: PQQ-dependent sugar dehydrogenase [Candidatus Daviesbacteria bacterium]
MKNLIIILGIIIILVGFWEWKSKPEQNILPSDNKTPSITVIAENLDTPWALVFLPASPAGGPGSSMLVTERPGRVRLVDNNGNLQSEPVATLSSAKEIGEGGLLGITIHPNFRTNNYVYLYYTYSGDEGNTLNRVVRMTYQDRHLKDEQIIVDKIPGASNHNGGRIKFGPDGFLYITTGDAQNPSRSQDKNSLAGKILKVTDDGKVGVYSYGHRNPQGITWDDLGNLWETEHGQTAADEVNLIQPAGNYGWPVIQGDQSQEDMVSPILHSGSNTWAPAGLTYYNGSLFFGGLRGQAFFEYNIESKKLTEHFKGEFGRIREVILGPDNLLYITTSNKDSRGNPIASDDRIIKIDPQKI